MLRFSKIPMANNIESLRQKAQALLKKAEVLETKQKEKVIKKYYANMTGAGITIEELIRFSGWKAKTSNTAKARIESGVVSKSPKIPVSPKYLGPNGEKWTGRGLAPKWLKMEMANGKSKEDFLIKK